MFTVPIPHILLRLNDVYKTNTLSGETRCLAVAAGVVAVVGDGVWWLLLLALLCCCSKAISDRISISAVLDFCVMSLHERQEPYRDVVLR